MRIIVQSSAFLPTPAPGAGAVEYLAGKLAEKLQDRGHDVSCVCMMGSDLQVTTHQFASGGSAAAIEGQMAKLIAASKAEVLFDHSLHQLAQRRAPDLPAVSMSHGMAPLSPWARNWVFTSEHHGRLHGMKKAPALRNGIDVDAVPFYKEVPWPEKPRLLWLGRIMEYKMPHLAIDIATAAGVPIVLAGPITSQAYYKKEIQPRLRKHGDKAIYLGEVTHGAVFDLLRDASALIFTSTPAEPAGVVLLEAQAAGRPVVAFKDGANQEFIGGGLLVKDPNAMKEAITDSFWTDFQPASCRAWVAEHRSIDGMAREAETFLAAALAGEGGSNARTLWTPQHAD